MKFLDCTGAVPSAYLQDGIHARTAGHEGYYTPFFFFNDWAIL